MNQVQTSLGEEVGTGWSTKTVDLWGLWGKRDASGGGGGGGGCGPPPPPPPPLTGLMKFINGKDNGNGPYFPSATRNRTSTDRAKAGGALILPPPPPSPPLSLSISALFYGYLKLLKA